MRRVCGLVMGIKGWLSWLWARMLIGTTAAIGLLWRSSARYRARARKHWLGVLESEGLTAISNMRWRQRQRADRCIRCGLCECLEPGLMALICDVPMESDHRMLTTEQQVARTHRLLAHRDGVLALCPAQVDTATLCAPISTSVE